MRIFICTMDDPVYTLPFIKRIINSRSNDIIGIAVSKADRLTIGKNKSKIAYLFSLLLIMGLWHFVKYVLIELNFKIKKYLSKKINFIENPSILIYAAEKDISVFEVQSVNNKIFLDQLKILKPDIIINQSQNILKKGFLSIPRIGVLNRHNALLPKNRGRLTPFWVLYKGEKESGVSIHFVEEGLDSGDIIVQERFDITSKDNFNTIVKKNYEIAPKAMLKALDLLGSEKYELIDNIDENATYNTIPTFKEAALYRWRRIVNFPLLFKTISTK